MRHLLLLVLAGFACRGEAGSTTGSADTIGEESDESTSAGDTGSGESGEEGPKLDIAASPDLGGSGCACGSELTFSFVWVANSSQGTVSKINTETLVEEGRYSTRPDEAGDPSRTSVSLDGRTVAVANRNGGLVAIHALPEDCDPMRNGVPGLQTSTGPGDVLAFDEEDCVAWFVPFDFSTQRPVAWTAGELDPQTCIYEDPRVWTAGCKWPDDALVTVARLEGATGDIADELAADDFPCDGINPYGGAVDAAGNLWIHSRDQQFLVRVDGLSLDTSKWDTPVWGYGIAVDDQGRPWLTDYNAFGQASAARFDPQTETWAIADNHLAVGSSGIQQDGEGRMWMAYSQYDMLGVNNPGLTWIDIETLEVGPHIDLPAGNWPKGVAVDLDGKVHVVDNGASALFRYDPDTAEIDSYLGLDGPYTYSDMTGWGLQNAACDPAG